MLTDIQKTLCVTPWCQTPNIWESSCQSCHCFFHIESISKEGCFCLANNSVKANLFLAYNSFILQRGKTRLYSQQATQTPVNTAETPWNHSSSLKEPAWSEMLVCRMNSPSAIAVFCWKNKSHGLWRPQYLWNTIGIRAPTLKLTRCIGALLTQRCGEREDLK